MRSGVYRSAATVIGRLLCSVVELSAAFVADFSTDTTVPGDRLGSTAPPAASTLRLISPAKAAAKVRLLAGSTYVTIGLLGMALRRRRQREMFA